LFATSREINRTDSLNSGTTQRAQNITSLSVKFYTRSYGPENLKPLQIQIKLIFINQVRNLPYLFAVLSSFVEEDTTMFFQSFTTVIYQSILVNRNSLQQNKQ
jgi:hypothetical protein